MENVRNFIFGNLGLKFLFWKSYHHILMHFVIKFQCFELILNVFQKTVFFLKFSKPLPISIDPFCFSINRNFLKILERASVRFDRSKLIFNRLNFFQNVLIESLSVSIDRGCFSIDRNSWNMFFLKGQNIFFKKISTFPLSPTWLKGSTKDFLSFSSEIYARFLS